MTSSCQLRSSQNIPCRLYLSMCNGRKTNSAVLSTAGWLCSSRSVPECTQAEQSQLTERTPHFDRARSAA
jgi:hypothetical protein